MSDKTEHTSVPELEQPRAALLASAADSGDEGEVTAPDLTPPDAPTDLLITGDGWVLTGKGEVGTTAIAYIINDQGARIEIGRTTVDTGGFFFIDLYMNLVRGEDVYVNLTDASGNTSDDGVVTAPVVGLKPGAPDLDGFNKEGTKLTGKGEPGCTVTVRDEEGNVLWTTEVDAQGNFSFDVDPPMVRAELVEVYQTNKDGFQSASSYARAYINVPDPVPADCKECEDSLQKLREEIAFLKGKISCCNLKPKPQPCISYHDHLNRYGFVNGIFRGHASIYRCY